MSNLNNDYLAPHFINKSNWLRAAVLGANDGILSTASLAVGVAAVSTTREPVVLATLAGMVAGALSMAAGEYVSVSSQTDIEQADIEREKKELEVMPEMELNMLTEIYVQRGLKRETALQVAKELTAHDALATHVRDELGISDVMRARPFQAALTSGASFILGALLPLAVSMFSSIEYMIYQQYAFAIVALITLGAFAARIGGSSIWKAIIRITFWGTLAMVLTAVAGRVFGVSIS